MAWLLIADDNADLRQLLAETLMKRGYHVETASNGADAVQVIETVVECPSAVVLDVLMPRVGGLAALRALRASGRTKNVPAIILSGMPMDDLELAGLDVSAVFIKPVALNALFAAIDRVCRRPPPA